MSEQDNKAIARRVYDEVWTKGDLDVIDELIDPDFVNYDPNSETGQVRGVAAFKQSFAELRNAFPDLRLTIEDQIAEGDKVAYRWKASGTHEGGLMGIPPTGNRMTITGTAIARISGGKIEEGWQNFDALGMMQQLGVIPEPGRSGQPT